MPRGRSTRAGSRRAFDHRMIRNKDAPNTGAAHSRMNERLPRRTCYPASSRCPGQPTRQRSGGPRPGTARFSPPWCEEPPPTPVSTARSFGTCGSRPSRFVATTFTSRTGRRGGRLLRPRLGRRRCRTRLHVRGRQGPGTRHRAPALRAYESCCPDARTRQGADRGPPASRAILQRWGR